MVVDGSSATSPKDPPDGQNTVTRSQEPINTASRSHEPINTASRSVEPINTASRSHEPINSTGQGENPSSDVSVTARGGIPDDVNITGRDGNMDGSSATGGNVTSIEGVKKKKKKMSALFGDITLLLAAFSCFNDSIQLHQPYEMARAHGGYYFYCALLFCEVFIVVPVMSILLHCANYTVSGISRFPQLYGKIFGFVGCGILIISLMQQSIAISDASSHIAWTVQTMNGTDEMVLCEPFTDDELFTVDHMKAYRKAFCTSIVKYKECVEHKLGRVWTRMDKTKGSCSWNQPDTLLFSAAEEYYNEQFVQDGESKYRTFNTPYLITYGVTWLLLVLFAAGLTFAGVKAYSIIVSGIAVLFTIFLSIIIIYLMSVGNIRAGHVRFIDLTQFHHIVKKGTVGIIAWCVLDSIILRFPVITLLSFRSQPFNPFHLGLGIGLSDICLKMIYFYVTCSIAGVFNQFAYLSAHNDTNRLPVTQIVMTEMFAMVSNVHWNRFYLFTLFLVDLPRVTVPFVLCHAIARDHFPKKNKWSVLGISSAIIVVFQCGMFFYFWKSTNPKDILNCVCGFYGMLLVSLLILSTVIVYGPMEFMLDVHSMSEAWRFKAFWRRIMAPICVLIANNALIPLLCFIGVSRLVDTFGFISITHGAAVCDVGMMCVPGVVMIGWLFYELGMTVYKKRLSPRLFYALPEHPSYDRAVVATFKFKKDDAKHKKKKDESETKKEIKR